MPVKQQLVIKKDVNKFIRSFEAYGRQEVNYEQVPQLESSDSSDNDDDQQPLLSDSHKIESESRRFNKAVSTSLPISVNKESAKSINRNSQATKGILKAQRPKKSLKAENPKLLKTEKSPKKSPKLTKKSDKAEKFVKKSPKATANKDKRPTATKSPKSSPKKSPKPSPKKSPKSNKSSKIKRKK